MPRITKWTIGAAVTVVAALGMLTLSLATAADPTGTITVTVEPVIVDIAILTGTVGFGVTEIGGDPVVTSDIGQTQTVENKTAAAILVGVRYSGTAGFEASCSTGDWEAGDVVGADIFKMQAELAGGSGLTLFPVPAGIPTAGLGSIASLVTVNLDYTFKPPASSTASGTCTIGTTVVATLAP